MNQNRYELLQLYETAQREYHFTVQLGHSRVAIYLPLNVALMAVLSSWGRSGLLVALTYLAGAAVATLFALATAVQHGYYRAARSHLQAIEHELGLLPLATTPGQQGDASRPRLRITGITIAVLYLMAAVDIVSAIIALIGK
jgi:hypothetical protein